MYLKLLNEKPPVKRPSVPLVPRPHSSPLLVVCITNPTLHTWDHFLTWYMPTTNIVSELGRDATVMSKEVSIGNYM